MRTPNPLGPLAGRSGSWAAVVPSSTGPRSATPSPIKVEASASAWARSALGFQPSPRQAEVLDAQDRFLILCCHRQWGKTTTIAVKALHHALSHPDRTIIIVSRTRTQAGILIDRAATLLAPLGLRPRRVLGHPFSLRFPNGSRIFAVAHSRETAVGNTAHVLIVDEAALVQDNVYWAVSPFVARTKGALWLLSTPRRQAGFFSNIWHSADPAWRRIFSSIHDGVPIDEAFLEMQRTADPIGFRQDFLCEFVQPAGRLVDASLLDRMQREEFQQFPLPQH